MNHLMHLTSEELKSSEGFYLANMSVVDVTFVTIDKGVMFLWKPRRR